jgi:hypothetical protein
MNLDAILQGIVGDVSNGQFRQFPLDLNAVDPNLRMTVGQDQRDYAATRSQIGDDALRARVHVMGQNNRIHGKPIPALMLLDLNASLKKRVGGDVGHILSIYADCSSNTYKWSLPRSISFEKWFKVHGARFKGKQWNLRLGQNARF